MGRKQNAKTRISFYVKEGEKWEMRSLYTVTQPVAAAGVATAVDPCDWLETVWLRGVAADPDKPFFPSGRTSANRGGKSWLQAASYSAVLPTNQRSSHFPLARSLISVLAHTLFIFSPRR